MADFILTVDPEASPSRDRADADKAGSHEPLWRHVLGDRLRTLRHDRGETLGDTAARAGVSPQYLSEMERGLKDPSSEMIAAVVGALDVTLGDLALDIAQSLTATAQLYSAQVSVRQSNFVLAA